MANPERERSARPGAPQTAAAGGGKAGSSPGQGWRGGGAPSLGSGSSPVPITSRGCCAVGTVSSIPVSSASSSSSQSPSPSGAFPPPPPSKLPSRRGRGGGGRSGDAWAPLILYRGGGGGGWRRRFFPSTIQGLLVAAPGSTQQQQQQSSAGLPLLCPTFSGWWSYNLSRGGGGRAPQDSSTARFRSRACRQHSRKGTLLTLPLGPDMEDGSSSASCFRRFTECFLSASKWLSLHWFTQEEEKKGAGRSLYCMHRAGVQESCRKNCPRHFCGWR